MTSAVQSPCYYPIHLHSYVFTLDSTVPYYQAEKRTSKSDLTISDPRFTSNQAYCPYQEYDFLAFRSLAMELNANLLIPTSLSLARFQPTHVHSNR